MLDICMSCRAQVGFCLLQKRLQTCTMEVTTWNLWVLLWCFCCYCFPGSFYPFSTPPAQQYLGWLVFKDLPIRFKQQNKKHISEKKEYTLPASEKYCEYHLVLFFTDIKARENAICSSLWWFKISTIRNRSTRTHCPLQAPAKRKKRKSDIQLKKSLHLNSLMLLSIAALRGTGAISWQRRGHHEASKGLFPAGRLSSPWPSHCKTPLWNTSITADNYNRGFSSPSNLFYHSDSFKRWLQVIKTSNFICS